METYVDTGVALESGVARQLREERPVGLRAPADGRFLNVLVVGDRYQGLTDEIVASTEGDGVTATPVDIAPPAIVQADAEEGGVDSTSTESGSLQKSQDHSSCSFLAAVFDDGNRRLGEDDGGGGELDLALYDCITDRGLIADLLFGSGDDMSKNGEDAARLLHEATGRICEMGIYVASTPPVSPGTKAYLRYLGRLLGLQWEFDLDGISDGSVSVSVARKNGTCPSSSGELGIRAVD